MTMWNAVITTTLLLAAVRLSAGEWGDDGYIIEYEKCNLDYEDIYSCNYENLCLFGCTDNKCWSQCNGAGFLSWPEDAPPGTCNNFYNLYGLLEWCWMSDAPESCSEDADCVGAKMNSCSGACTVDFSNMDNPGESDVVVPWKKVE